MEFDYLPITDAREIQAFLARVPLVVERERFTRFVLGFPHHYLKATPPVEVLRHFGLVSLLGRRAAATSVAREGPHFRLVVVAADRSHLFSRIAGSLSFFGANIVTAEAFANTESVVLDTFTLEDTSGRFREPEESRRFQAFLERVIEGTIDLEQELGARGHATRPPLLLRWSAEAHPFATLLEVSGADSLGLLHDIARALSLAGCSIEIARIQTQNGQIEDTFYLTAGGGKLDASARQAVEGELRALAR